MQLSAKQIGYYVSASQPSDQPSKEAVDPACPICGEPWTEEDVRSHSLCPTDRSFCVFYRTHHTCAMNNEAAIPVLDAQALELGRKVTAS